MSTIALFSQLLSVLLLLLSCSCSTTRLVLAVDEFMPGYYCGVDQFTKTLSMVVSASCPRDRLNWCCYYHDQCYSANSFSYYRLRECDQQLGYCIYNSYIGDNPYCANLLYNTHAKAAELFGDAYKQQMIQQARRQWPGTWG